MWHSLRCLTWQNGPFRNTSSWCTLYLLGHMRSNYCKAIPYFLNHSPKIPNLYLMERLLIVILAASEVAPELHRKDGFAWCSISLLAPYYTLWCCSVVPQLAVLLCCRVVLQVSPPGGCLLALCVNERNFPSVAAWQPPRWETERQTIIPTKFGFREWKFGGKKKLCSGISLFFWWQNLESKETSQKFHSPL